MNNRIKPRHAPRRETLITNFGRAKLIRTTDGATELRDAHAQDFTTAKEWISLFMHEAVLRS
jgi:hypothetical protein